MKRAVPVNLEGLFARLGKVVLLVFAVILLGTAGYKVLEPKSSWLDCLYMTVITVATVGYGEVVPVKDAPTRIFTIILIMVGMSVVLYGVSTVTAFVVEGTLSEVLARRQMMKEIAALRDHYIVCGAGATGLYIIEELIQTRRQFVVIDNDEGRLRTLAGQSPLLYVVGDATEDDVLRQAGIERAQGLIAALATDRDNLFLTITARQLNPKLRIVAKGIELSAMDKLRRAGADSVVSPNHIGGLRMVSELVRPAAVGFLDAMLREREHPFRFEEVTISEGSELCGKSLADARLSNRTGALVMAYRKEDLHFVYNPPPATVLAPGMTLVVLADMEGLQKLRALAQQGS